jgi:hypothetical protein
MDREAAQNILQLCRPDNLEDRNDPLVAEALELLSKDDTLRVWFEEQQAFDTAISDELNNIEPPAELKASILVGMRAHALQAESLQGNAAGDESAHRIPFPRSDKRTTDRSIFRPWMGVAAALAIAAVALMQQDNETPAQLANNTSTATGNRFETAVVATAGAPNMIEFLAQQISEFNVSKFDKRGEQLGELQSHLASTGMPNPMHIPKQLEALATLGCVTLDYEGSKLSMICFKNGQIYHLITADKGSVPKDCAPCAGQKVKFFEAQQQAFKIWSEGEQIFILTTQGTEEDLPDFI